MRGWPFKGELAVREGEKGCFKGTLKKSAKGVSYSNPELADTSSKFVTNSVCIIGLTVVGVSERMYEHEENGMT